MTLIKSTFKNGAEGWTMGGDVASSGWVATGGVNGGYYGWTDAAKGQAAYYIAPKQFLGDKSAYFRGHIAYDIFDTGNNLKGLPDLGITGADGKTIYVSLSPVGTEWTHESVKLASFGGWIDAATGTAAKDSEIRDILKDVTGIIVRAEYYSGKESGGLDSFRLLSGDQAPAPSHGGAHMAADLAPFHAHAPLDHGHLAIA